MNTLILGLVLTATPAGPVDISVDYGKPATASKKRSEYSKCVEHVEKTGDCVLVIGPWDGKVNWYYQTFHVDKLKKDDGTPHDPGVYLCYRDRSLVEGGANMMRPLRSEESMPAKSVVPQVTFPFATQFQQTCVGGNCPQRQTTGRVFRR